MPARPQPSRAEPSPAPLRAPSLRNGVSSTGGSTPEGVVLSRRRSPGSTCVWAGRARRAEALRRLQGGARLPLPDLGAPTMGTRDDEYDYLFKGNSRAASSPRQPGGVTFPRWGKGVPAMVGGAERPPHGATPPAPGRPLPAPPPLNPGRRRGGRGEGPGPIGGSRLPQAAAGRGALRAPRVGLAGPGIAKLARFWSSIGERRPQSARFGRVSLRRSGLCLVQGLCSGNRPGLGRRTEVGSADAQG